MTCLESFVRFAEINQWPLDFITRIHVHVCERPPFERQRQRQRQTETDRQSETDRQTDRERQKVRQEDSPTSRHRDRQQERQTDKQKHCFMSHPFSLFPFHAKPGLTRP